MVNEWRGLGRLTADVELRETNSGKKVANFTLACGESWTDKKTGEKKDRTEFVRIVNWFNAEACAKYLGKGSQAYVSGRICTRNYEKDGVKHYITEIIADTVKFLGGKNDRQEQAQQATPQTEDKPPF
jgi:single-strand DNA-binding protein